MNPLTILESERLCLRIPDPADAAHMVRYLTDNREHFAPWNPVRPKGYYSVPYWNGELEGWPQQAEEETAIHFILTPRPDTRTRIVGHCNFAPIIRGAFQAAFLGYAIDYRYEGQGLMGKALEMAIDFVFGELNLHRVMANYMPANERSGRLLRRLGFVAEGFARDYLRLAGQWQDHILTARINPAWDSR